MNRLQKQINKYMQRLLEFRYTEFRPEFDEFTLEFKEFQHLSELSAPRFSVEWKDRLPCLDDKTATTSFEPHYTYHPAWAVRVLASLRPSVHVDISSSLSFCTMLSGFVPVEFYDLRPAQISLAGLTCRRGDLAGLPFPDNSVESLSCMHVVEHIGLGRYGDPLNPDGDLKAMAELKRVLAPDGSLLFVTPVGKPRVRFNAHRIYSYKQVLSYFLGLKLEQFALVDDDGEFSVDADPAYADQQEWGCGCWWFKK
jgi:SAM-dependent methyltransferase